MRKRMLLTELNIFVLVIGWHDTDPKEETMGKVKAWLMDMEEDAMSMNRGSWIEKHGLSNVSVYDEVRRNMEEFIGSSTVEDAERYNQAIKGE